MSPASSQTILVVDDEAPLRSVVCELVAGMGLSAVPASDGAEALEIFRRAAPDVVITDLRMPGVDGLALLEAVHDADPDVPVVLISAYGDMSELTGAVRLGAFDFLAKPFDLDPLERILRRALEHRRLLRERRAQAENNRRLESLARAINAEADVEGLGRWCREHLPGTLGVRLFSLFVYDEGRATLQLTSTNHVPMPTGGVLKVADLRGPMRYAVERHGLVFVEGFAASAYGGTTGESQRRRYGDDHSATLPLVVRGRLVGVLNLNDKLAVAGDGARAFSDVDEAFLSIAAEHLASALAVRRESQALSEALHALEKAQGQLIISEKLAAVAKLVAGVAHEIKNPLTSMYFASVNLASEIDRLAVKGGSAERGHRFVETLQHDIERLRGRIDAMMIFVRPGERNRRIIEPVEMLRAVLDSVMARAEALGVGLRTLLGALPPLRVDPDGFHEAVNNLLVNALEASPRGASVSLGARLEGATLVVSVEDAGAGVPAELERQIFDLFFTTKPGGSGVGLSQVHVFCDTHGGAVRYERRGERTCFEMRLPVASEGGNP